MLVVLDRVDSTNSECKRRALAGEPGALAVMAREQTAGRGRRGRSFQSRRDQGLYLSYLFYPQAPAAELSQFTAWAAVAACRAIEGMTGFRPDIKWPNDLLAGRKKLCGILTETGEGPGGRYVVVGVGVNLTQSPADFGPELAPVATSLAQLGAVPPAEELAQALLGELEAAGETFPREKQSYLKDYRERCVTLGREVRLISPLGTEYGTALEINEDFSLRVRDDRGRTKTVSAGEVSVRGLLGYT